MVISLERGADSLCIVQLMPLPSQKPPLSLALFKFRLVLPFWYQLTRVVLENRPLNGCSSSLTQTLLKIALLLQQLSVINAVSKELNSQH